MKFRDFLKIWGFIILKVWCVSKLPSTNILICLVLTQIPKDIWIGHKLRPQWPFKIFDWEMAIIVAILMCYICIIILNIWSYLQSSAMSYLQNLFHIVNCSTFYMKWNVYFSWIAREFTSRFSGNYKELSQDQLKLVAFCHGTVYVIISEFSNELI